MGKTATIVLCLHTKTKWPYIFYRQEINFRTVCILYIQIYRHSMSINLTRQWLMTYVALSHLISGLWAKKRRLGKCFSGWWVTCVMLSPVIPISLQKLKR